MLSMNRESEFGEPSLNDALNIFKHLVLFVCKKIFLLKSVNDFRGL